jgi:hypothetical protein
LLNTIIHGNMVKAQEYINQKYQKDAEIISENAQNLEGDLIIENFPDLKKIECRNNKGLTSIKLINLSKLDYFHGNGCHLEEVIVKDCPSITFFNVANNYLSDLTFLDDLNSEKLKILSLHTNNFPEQDLSFISKFLNLEQLFLDNCDEEKFKENIYNRFSGSLEPLQKLEKLELLSIGNTNIDSGLEYLPKSFRKIGLNTSWWETDTSCFKLRQELEKAVQVEGVTEKLKSEQEKNSKGQEDPDWFSDYYRLAPWRQAQKLGGKKLTGKTAQEWLDKHYPKQATGQKKRENVIFLNINGKNLEGDLKLESFTNLERLDCSFNQLTNLDLSGCQSLTHFNCSWNNFINTSFLETIPNKNKEKLEVLRINNNEKIKENLEFLTSFIGLTTLNLENCLFFGSLEPLKNMSKLEKVYISNTHISGGLEFLPSSCEKFYCDTSDQKYKSIKIANELSKFSKKEYYDVSKWKEDSQNKAALVIPLERLYVIRSNIKKFINKWGAKENDGKSELSNLQIPREFNQYQYLGSAELASNFVATVGGALSLADYATTGGVISFAFPLIGTGISQIKEKFYDAKEKKWEEFVKDSEELLDNYHELLGILQKIKVSELGEVNKALKNLNNKTNEFLKRYDEDNNGTVDVAELEKKRKILAEDLDKEDEILGGGSQLGNIVQAILKLEEEIIDYRQGSIDKKEAIEFDFEIKEFFNKRKTEEQSVITNEELERKIKGKLGVPMEEKNIRFVFLGFRDKKQILVISKYKRNLFDLFRRCTVCELLGSYSLDLAEYKPVNREVIMNEDNNFPKRFRFEEEVVKEAVRFELENQEIGILGELRGSGEETKKLEAETKKKKEERKKKELISAIKIKLLEEKIAELQKIEGQELLVRFYEEEMRKLVKEKLDIRELQVREKQLLETQTYQEIPPK